MKWKALAVAILLCVMGLTVWWLERATNGPIETIDVTRADVSSAPAMCPWRDPPHDMQAFFPGATAYRTDVLILSRLRLQITKRLGPDTPLEVNALYLYRIERSGRPVGTVLVRRTAGQYGAIEVVAGVGPDGHVVGMRLQRLREPPAIAGALTAPGWLGAFRGKTASSAFRIGGDLPDVPPAARESARAVARAVRALLIEFESGEAAQTHQNPVHHRGTASGA
jgi:hypothetical protein